ncbi:MAG: hypothetical protein DIU68_008885 [Chloroflexota bacterium]|nr:MAG: hypothetical protein DIU68_14855 [Chloroflexota bacterium]
MTTWRVWQALLKPPQHHPLYIRIARAPAIEQLLARALPLTALVILVMLCILPSLISVVLGLLAALPLVFPLIVNLYALRWAITTSSTVAALRERGLHDLLCLTPPGALGATWIVATACVHRDGVFRRLHILLHSLIGLSFLIMIALSLVMSTGVEPARTSYAVPAGFYIDVIGLIVLFYADYFQTIVLGITLGLAVSLSEADRPVDRILASAIFPLVQLTLYLLVGLVGFRILPYLYTWLEVTSAVAYVGLFLIRLVLLCGLREALIVVLWRRIARRADAPEQLLRSAGWKPAFQVR